jgi:hypothetical protein
MKFCLTDRQILNEGEQVGITETITDYVTLSRPVILTTEMDETSLLREAL